MKRKSPIPLLAFALVGTMALGALLVGIIAYLIVGQNTAPEPGQVIQQQTSPPAPLQSRPTQPAGLAPVDAAPTVSSDGLITPQQAREIIEQATGLRVHEIELERERGVVVYEARAGEYRVYVDAQTGQILYQREND